MNAAQISAVRAAERLLRELASVPDGRDLDGRALRERAQVILRDFPTEAPSEPPPRVSEELATDPAGVEGVPESWGGKERRP